LARANPRWGYLRIVGKLRKLGITVGMTSVASVLGRHGLSPAPRRNGPTWTQFPRAPARGVLATDFFGIETIRTPVRAPRANAFAERWVRTVREDCLDHLLMISRAHPEQVLSEYVQHYNEARPHRGLKLVAPNPRSEPRRIGTVIRRDVLGGIIREYERVA
jgi:hypothetical protein